MLSSAVAAEYENLYLIGDATDADWSLDNAIEMDHDGNGIFTWTGVLRVPGEKQERFKFLTVRGWENSYTCRFDIEGHLMITSGEENKIYPFNEGDGYDNSFQVPVTGIYMIMVDMNDEIMTCVLIEEILDTLELDQLYVIGGALSPDGEWDYENPAEMTKVEEGVFTWTGNLYNFISDEKPESNQFKFVSEKGEWDKTVVSKDENVEIAVDKDYALHYRPLESNPNDYKFIVTVAGEYTINVDLNTMKMTVKDGTGLGIANINNTSLYNVTSLKGAINVQADDLLRTVALYDITGKCLVSVANAGNEITLGENLANGIYIVKVAVNNETTSQKVIIK